MTVEIAPLTSAHDIDRILEVEQASFTNPWTKEMYLAELANPDVARFLLARAEEGAVVGFCSFWRILDELHINNLAVLPAFRRAGIGSALLTRVLQEANATGAVRALLEVRRSNEAARRLYERFGFFVVRIRRDYYTNPQEDALVLGREGPMATGDDHK